jgi:predicted DNA-binding transcriptional regulator YafY
MRTILFKAMQAADEYVISLDYVDNQGVVTRRIVSPIRFLAPNRFLGLCLCREEPRQFYMDRCHNVRLCRAADFVMPVPVMTWTPPAPACV